MNEIKVAATTGSALYAIVFDAGGQVWDGTELVVINQVDWSDYAISLDEVGTTGLYFGTMPAVAEGNYDVLVYSQRGATADPSDQALGVGNIEWNGVAVAHLYAQLDELEAALLGGLNGATVTVVSSVLGGTVTVYVADTWRFTVASDQLDLADYEALGLVVKRNERQADSQALLYVRSDTGLARIGGAAPASAGNGTLTAGASSFTAVIHVAETQAVKPGGYTWWLKGFDTSATPDEAVTLATGEFVVLAAGLQAVA